MREITLTISSSKAFLISPPIQTSSQMNLLFNIPPTMIIPLKLSTFSCFHPKIPIPVRITSSATSFRVSASTRIPPARDRVIDLGRYKGKMLGSLPSSYLKWVSKNLRAGDTEEWAKLADEVLSDPVYRDRIEWEFAEKVLQGNASIPSSKGNGSDAVSELLEISERFGWDNEDKGGWSKIDFGLLGTSKGGRIPRAMAETNVDWEKKEEIEVEERLEEDGGRRRERRERVRRRRVNTSSTRRVSSTSGDGGGTSMRSVYALKRRMEKVGGYGNREETVKGQSGEEGEGEDRRVNPVDRSPFPGREALLINILNRQRLL